jgi:hypothetical protein
VDHHDRDRVGQLTVVPATEGPGVALGQATLHGSFAVERDLAASPDLIYAAYDGDGTRDVAHLKGGTNLQLNGLAAALDATR